MKFMNPKLNESLMSLLDADDDATRFIGENCAIEENVSDRRREQVEDCLEGSADVHAVLKRHFHEYVTGTKRDQVSSTFDEKINILALLSSNPKSTRKIVRIEEVSEQVPDESTLFILNNAIKEQNPDALEDLLIRKFKKRDSRPCYAAYKSDVSADLREKDWLQIIIDRLGLYNYYERSFRPEAPPRTLTFALMEYTVGEVVNQAGAKGVKRCFAVPTVLEAPDYAAFYPAPRETQHGFCVDLGERDPHKPSVQEILHFPFKYSWNHLHRLQTWSCNHLPNLENARIRHRNFMSSIREHEYFGKPQMGGHHG